jgi:predicted nuclease with TOPRIM domain
MVMSSASERHTPSPGGGHARLAELLEQQESLFLRLDALSRRQSQLVLDEQTDDLLRVLGERQELVEALEQASREAEPYRRRWDEVLAAAAPAQRERIRAQVERLAQLAAEIAARDDADRREIERRRDRLAGDLAGVGRVRGAVAAYGPVRQRPAAKFQDTEG